MDQDSEQELVKPRIDFTTKKEIRQKEVKQLRLDMERISGTEGGRNVLRAIMNLCGIRVFATDANPATGEINPYNTVYNVGRQNVWLTLADLIPRKDLIEIEYPTPLPIKQKYDEDDE